jgi:hypothetical protein
MKRFSNHLITTLILAASFAWQREARAQHVDVMVLQIHGRLATGAGDFESGEWTLGQRVYSREFDSDFLVNNPGFNSLGAGSPLLPPGSQALPAVTNLSWDFLPMEIGSATSNLFYWDGSESDGQPGLTIGDVSFGAPPGQSYTLTTYDRNSQPYSIHASDQAVVPGGAIARTDASGFMHQHNYFLLDDGSGYQGTSPADGIYLWALQVRMPGLQTSLPFFMVFGTPGSSVAALDNAAVPWVQEQVDLAGDFNGDGRVDAADYSTWRDTLAQTGSGLAADGNGDQVVDAGDFTLWKQHYGEAAELRIAPGLVGGGAVAGVVPEPSTVLVAWTVGILVMSFNRRERRARRGPGSVRPRC